MPGAPFSQSSAAPSALVPEPSVSPESDIPTEFQVLQRGATAGDAEAQFNLGGCYAEGRGVAKSMDMALQWWRKAAKQGQVGAMSKLANAYATGETGGKPNFSEAVRWWKLAAARGDGDAQYNLGVASEQGLGTAKNEARAADWYRKAALQNVVEAQFNLAGLYREGRGVKRNAAEAVRWFTPAAEKGIPEAMFRLAEYHRDGKGVKKDRAQAFFWFSLAGSRGYPGAQEAMGKLMPLLTKAESDTAREKLMAWMAKSAPKPASAPKSAEEEKK